MAYTESQMLEMMKADLQKLNPPTSETNYYLQLIQTSQIELKRTGIELDLDDIAHIQLIVMYASWLYRKRVNGDAMPRMLQMTIRQVLFSQKAK